MKRGLNFFLTALLGLTATASVACPAYVANDVLGMASAHAVVVGPVVEFDGGPFVTFGEPLSVIRGDIDIWRQANGELQALLPSYSNSSAQAFEAGTAYVVGLWFPDREARLTNLRTGNEIVPQGGSLLGMPRIMRDPCGDAYVYPAESNLGLQAIFYGSGANQP